MKTSITDKLDALHIDYTIKHHTRPVFTSEDAARERRVRLSQIVKTMLLTNQHGKIVVAVLPGNKRLNLKKLRRLTGSKALRLMDRGSVEHNLGLVAGAIAPVADVLTDLPLYVDPGVFSEATVDISSGDPRAGLELKRKDLKRLVKGATIAEIT